MAVRLDNLADRIYRTATVPNGNANYAILFWAKINAYSEWAVFGTINKDTDFSRYDYFGFNGNTSELCVTRANGAETIGYSGVNESLNTYHHYALVSSGNDLKLYRDATLIGTATRALTGATSPTRIEFGGFSTSNYSAANIDIAYIRVYDAALSDAEIAVERNSATPVRTTNLWSNWRLENSTDLADTSGNNRNLSSSGTLTNATDPTLVLSVSLPLLSNAPVLYPQIISAGSVTVQIPLLNTTATLYEPTITSDAVTVTLPLLTSTNQFYTSTVSPDAVTVQTPLLTNSITLYLPTIIIGGTLDVPLLIDDNQLYTPTLFPGSVLITVPKITTTQTFYTPQLDLTVSVPYLDTVTALYTPSLNQDTALQIPLLSNTSFLFTPVVATGEVTLTVPILTSTTYVFPAEIAYTVGIPLLVNISTLYPQTIIVGSVTLTLSLLTNTHVFYSAIISGGAVTVAIYRDIGTVSIQHANQETLSIGYRDYAEL